jgi:hypothetical protein
MEKILAILPNRTIEDAKALASEAGMSLSNLTRLVLEEYIERIAQASAAQSSTIAGKGASENFVAQSRSAPDPFVLAAARRVFRSVEWED